MSEVSTRLLSERSAGLEVPVFAIPREGDLGCGDTQVVHELIDLAHALGLQSLTILPIQETVKGNDPFSPLSLFALDPIHIDASPEKVADISKESYEAVLASFPMAQESSQRSLRYNRVKKLKLDLLWRGFEAFWETHYLKGTERARNYHRFCTREGAWLPDYSLYRMLMDFEQGRESWEDWSEDYGRYADAKQFVATIAAKKPEAVERQLAFYAYVQWIADTQWQAVKAHAERCEITLITDLRCAISPHCVEFFRAPDSYRTEQVEGQRKAVCEENLLGQLEARLRRLAPLFDQFRVLDFQDTTTKLDGDGAVQAFLKRFPQSTSEELTENPIKVAWESLPSLSMQTTELWPAPNGKLIPPMATGQSFTQFGSESLKRLWTHDKVFRRRLVNQWSVDPKEFGQETSLSLLRKLFQYPGRHVHISFLDLAGLENDPGTLWLARFEKGPRDLMEDPHWDRFRTSFRKILEQTSRLRPVSSPEKALESV